MKQLMRSVLPILLFFFVGNLSINAQATEKSCEPQACKITKCSPKACAKLVKEGVCTPSEVKQCKPVIETKVASAMVEKGMKNGVNQCQPSSTLKLAKGTTTNTGTSKCNPRAEATCQKQTSKTSTLAIVNNLISTLPKKAE